MEIGRPDCLILLVRLTVEFSKQICDGVQGVRNDFAGNPKVLN